MNIGILLSAGNSQRFNHEIQKQLFKLNSKHIIEYSLDIMDQLLDLIIIITNNNCYASICEITKQYKNIIILLNDNESRNDSIFIGLSHIINNNFQPQKIIIHDSARPFIKKFHIENLLSCSDVKYKQYCIKLTNGLAKIKNFSNNDFICDVVDRNKYIEICTPISIDFDLLLELNINEPFNEFIDLLNKKNIKYELIESTNYYLRKITYFDDVLF